MQQAMRTVKLYGKMGALFGREHRLSVKSPAEAVKALCVTIPGFEKYMANSEKNGLRFAVFSGKHNISEGELTLGGNKDIRIAPVPSGSKRNGLFQTILGVILIAVGFFAFGSTTAIGASLIAGGIATGLGGIIQMLSPQPKGLGMDEETENKPSKMLGGAVNTTAFGNPVAVLAGYRTIGGAIISASVVSEDQA